MSPLPSHLYMLTISSTRIRIQTTTPHLQTLEGTLFTICPLTSLLAISTTSPQSHHIIPLSTLTSFTILSPPPTDQVTSVPPLKTSALLARANTALNLAKEKASRVNKEVGKEAQEIFDALYKQFPGTRWAEKNIVVLDVVLIQGPGYKGEDVKANKDGERALKQVRKVVSRICSG